MGRSSLDENYSSKYLTIKKVVTIIKGKGLKVPKTISVSVVSNGRRFEFDVEVVVNSASDWEAQGIYFHGDYVDDILSWETMDDVYDAVAEVIEQGAEREY